MIATMTMNSRNTSPLLVAGIIGLLIGVVGLFCITRDGYFCELMTVAPMYFMYVISMTMYLVMGMIGDVWLEVIVVAYYMTICMLPVYLSRYIPTQYLSRKKSLILVVVVTLTAHAVFTYLGGILMGEIVRGMGDIIRHGALDGILGGKH